MANDLKGSPLKIDTIRQQVFDGEGTLRSDKTLKHNVCGKDVEVENPKDAVENQSITK
jgi:hypothetical protein